MFQQIEIKQSPTQINLEFQSLLSLDVSAAVLIQWRNIEAARGLCQNQKNYL